MQNLREIFDLFDKEKTGSITLKDLEAIMQSLQRDSSEARELVSQLRADSSAPAEQITFDDFIALMQQVESKLAKAQNAGNMSSGQIGSQGVINITADNKVLDFLRLLEEYRRKCEIEGNYQEAKKASGKFEELLKKETIRQKNNIRAAQEQELQNIEAAQKAQFLEFS